MQDVGHGLTDVVKDDDTYVAVVEKVVVFVNFHEIVDLSDSTTVLL